MDGLAVLSLKPSVVELGVASYADVHHGALMRGTVASVEDYGVFVALTPSVKRAPRPPPKLCWAALHAVSNCILARCVSPALGLGKWQ